MVNTLELKNISFSYKKDKLVLKNINIQLLSGKINALLGINGSGKTTLFKILTGFYKPLSGSIYYNNLLITPANIIDYKKNIGFMPEFLNLYKNLTVQTVLEMLSDLKGYNKFNLDDILKAVFLYEHKNKKVKALSKGMKQRLNLAQAIIGDPKIILFDEPSNGFDCGSITMFYNTLKNLAKKDSIILLSSHHLTEIHGNVDNVIILSEANIVKEININSINEKENISKELHLTLNDMLESNQHVNILTKFPNILINNKKYIKYTTTNKGIIDLLTHLITLNLIITDIKINDNFLEDILLNL